MRLAIFSCWLCVLLAGCSLPKEVASPELAVREAAPGRMLNIRIERWDTLRFAGLLGLRQTAGGLDYILLDATGVKLLQAEVAGDGSFTLKQESGPLHKTGLAPFLSEALARIYLQEPVRPPCAGSWWYRLCRQEDERGARVKYGQAWPFTVWRVTGGDGQGEAAVTYQQPWLGVKVKLEPLPGGGGVGR